MAYTRKRKYMGMYRTARKMARGAVKYVTKSSPTGAALRSALLGAAQQLYGSSSGSSPLVQDTPMSSFRSPWTTATTAVPQSLLIRGRAKNSEAGRSRGKRLGRPKRKVKRMGKWAKSLKNGLVYTLENRGNVSNAGAECHYLGHGTGVGDIINQQVFRMILKMIVAKQGHNIRAFTDSAEIVGSNDTGIFRVGDQIVFRFFPNHDSTLELTAIYSYVAGHTYEQVATGMSTALLTAGNIQMRMKNVTTVPSGASTSFLTYQVLNLQGVKFTYNMKSSLKIQNRTVTAELDNEADDVNNVPLYGKSYFGKGTGTLHASSREGFIISRSKGTFALFKVKDEILSEPPQPQQFIGVKSTGKVRIEPGDIKTSVLTETKSFNFNNYLYWHYSLGVYGKSYSRLFGKFMFIAIEKIIGSDASDIKYTYEHNIRCVISAQGKQVNFTDEINDQNDNIAP